MQGVRVSYGITLKANKDLKQKYYCEICTINKTNTLARVCVNAVSVTMGSLDLSLWLIQLSPAGVKLIAY